MTDLRTEQVDLLRFEQDVAALAVRFAELKAATLANTQAVVGDAAIAVSAEIEAAIVNLAQVTSTGHAAIEQSAVDAGARLLQVGGAPKQPPHVYVDAIARVLGV